MAPPDRIDRPHRPLFLPRDLVDIGALGAAMAEAKAKARLGPIAVLVNDGADDKRHAADEISEADRDRAIALNLKHQFFAAKFARPSKRDIGGGSIVNISSTARMLGRDRLAAYSAVKAAILGLTKSLAREFVPDSIRVDAIPRGAAIAERQRRVWIGDKELAAILARQCLGEILLAEEVALAALFLAAADRRMITKRGRSGRRLDKLSEDGA